MMKYDYDVIVLGAGPVGSYCAYLASNKGLKTLLVEATNKNGGQPLNLYAYKQIVDFPLFSSISAIDFVNKINEQLATEKKVETIYNTKMTDFEIKDNVIYCHFNDKVIKTKNIIIATGNGIFSPNLLEIPGSLNHPDVEYIVRPYSHYQNKEVVILGGGDSAVDWANNIAKNTNAKINIIHRRDVFRANGENVDCLAKNNVNVYLNKQCLKIEGNILYFKDNVSGKEENIKFDKLIVQYGQKIDVNPPQYIQKLEHTPANKIIVNHSQMSNINGIYAIGNACFYNNRPNLIIAGMGEAAMAINDILIKIKKYDEHKIA